MTDIELRAMFTNTSRRQHRYRATLALCILISILALVAVALKEIIA